MHDLDTVKRGRDILGPNLHHLDLAGARAAIAALEAQIDFLVWDARDEGQSWESIGAALGISRQAAQQRFRVSERARTNADLRAKYPVLGPVPSAPIDRTPVCIHCGARGCQSEHSGPAPF